MDPERSTPHPTPPEHPVLNRLVMGVEFPVKKALFGCRACGACILSRTHLICPMTCPKGIRNGPCGGTLDGMCEVLTDRPCVWLRIRGKEDEAVKRLSLFPPFAPSLFGTSSLVNSASGADAGARRAVSIPSWEESSAPRTKSRLERLLLSGRKVLTAELQSPKTRRGFGPMANLMERLLSRVDAFNTTSHAGGRFGISSREAAAVVTGAGGEAVVQVCGRDVTPAEFLDELIAAAEAGVSNVLCLTGDWPADGPRGWLPAEEARERFFPMDSSQMILEARHLSEERRSLFGALEGRVAPTFFIGAAANPWSKPMETAVARTEQKARCGARFIQTQVVCEVDSFCAWRDELRKSEPGRCLKVIASIPIIGSARALDFLGRIPGVAFPAEVEASLRAAASLEGAALDFATRLMRELLERQAADGFHLVPFSAGSDLFVEVARHARSLFERDRLTVDLL